MNFVVGRCKHEPSKYCKNWDGRGNFAQLLEQNIGTSPVGRLVKCPKNHRDCSFKVVPKPVGEVNKGGSG